MSKCKAVVDSKKVTKLTVKVKPKPQPTSPSASQPKTK